jgi:hypothetical protein
MKRRSLGKALEVIVVHHVEAEERIEIHDLQASKILLHADVVEIPLDALEIQVKGWVFRPDEEQIVLGERPEECVGEDAVKRSDKRLHVLQRHVVAVEPLADESAFGQTRPHDLEELAGEERAHACHPGVRGFGDDDVVRLAREQKVAPCIVEDHTRAGTVEDAIVDVLEEPGSARDLG